MSSNAKNEIPKAVISRYTRYLTALRSLREEGVHWVASRELADRLHLTSSTVRQDLSYIDFSGISKKGYESEGLEAVLEKVLGVDAPCNVVVVGAGNLGRAIAQHEDFIKRGFNISGIFDDDKAKIGMKVGSLVVSDVSSITRFIKSGNVSIGIIVVPESAAQEVADMLVKAGVQGILNFTSTQIDLSDNGVVCIEARLVECLQELSHAISRKK